MVKFSKSLSFGIGVACFSTMLFLSSCSKEDSLVPQSESASVKNDANMRGVGFLPVERLPSLGSSTCKGCIPEGWSLFSNYQHGMSNGQSLFGQTPWTKPLGNPSTGQGPFITLGYVKDGGGTAQAKIKNLKEGKKYKLTFSVSTASVKDALGVSSDYASKVRVYVRTDDNEYMKEVNVGAKPDQWITESLIFTADFDMSYDLGSVWALAFPSSTSKVAYANVHFGSIQPMD